MNPNARIFKVPALLLLLLTVIAPNTLSQESKKPLTRAELITAAREVMAASRYCALITLDSSGQPQARTLDPFPPDENMVVWLGTNPRSRKVAAIRRNPRVTLYYFDRDEQAYVTISGIARLVNDEKEKAKRWKDEWKEFYPDRVKDYLLIVVKPESLEVVNVKKGILGDPITWKPPVVNFPKSPKPQIKKLNSLGLSGFAAFRAVRLSLTVTPLFESRLRLRISKPAEA